MKDKIRNFLKEKSFIIFISLLIITVVIIPLPVLLVEILITLNIIFSITLFVIVLNKGNVNAFSLYPTIDFLLTVFGLAVNVSATRLILSKGAELDGWLIKYFSYFLFDSIKEIPIIGIILFLVLICCHTLIVVKECSHVSETACRFTLDAFQVKLLAVEIEYGRGVITEDEAQERKREIQKESDFFGELDGVSKIVSGNEKNRIIIIIISFICVILIGTWIRGETIIEAVKICFPFIIGNGILCMLPALLVSTATEIIITRKANIISLKKNFRNIPDNE